MAEFATDLDGCIWLGVEGFQLSWGAIEVEQDAGFGFGADGRSGLNLEQIGQGDTCQGGAADLQPVTAAGAGAGLSVGTKNTDHLLAPEGTGFKAGGQSKSTLLALCRKVKNRAKRGELGKGGSLICPIVTRGGKKAGRDS